MQYFYVIQAIRTIFGLIDNVIYGLLANIYDIIMLLPTVDLFRQEFIGDITSRIYTFLGIFMLFKISFSFINFIINPDKFSDNQNGFGKIIGNILLTLMMLMAVPWAFTLLKNVQNAILNDHIIDNIIFGNKTNIVSSDVKFYAIKFSDQCADPIVLTDEGEYFALMVARPFYQYDSNVAAEFSSDPEKYSDDQLRGVLCQNTLDIQKIENLSSEDKLKVYNYINDDISSDYARERITNPITTLASQSTLGESTEDQNKETILSYITGGFTRWVNDLNNSVETDNDYQINYLFIASTIVGLIVCGLLISTGLDIAVRTIKLAFLQIIAPIPIISFVDPDKSKHKMFNNWLQDVWKTWVSLFVRLFIIYLIIEMLNLLDSALDFDEFEKFKFLMSLFFIIGGLIFAKKFVPMLESLTGIKFDDKLSINPLKKLKDEALGGKQIANGVNAIGGATVAAGSAAIAHGIAKNAAKKKFNEENNKLNDIRAKAKVNVGNAVASARQAQKDRVLKQQSIDADALKRQNAADVARDNMKKQAKAEWSADVAKNGASQEALDRYTKRLSDIDSKHKAVSDRIQSYKASNEAAANQVVNEAKQKAIDAYNEEYGKVAAQRQKVSDANKKILKHGPLSTAGEIGNAILQGGKAAYKADTLNVGQVIGKGLEGQQAAAKKREYREDFSILDEFRDKLSDFANIKNESGTSSFVDQEKKRLINEISRLDNTLRQLDNQIASLSINATGAAKAEIINLTSMKRDEFIKNYSSYSDYKSQRADTKLSKDDFDAIYAAVNAAVKAQNEKDDATKKVKKFDSMEESKKKK